MLKHQKDWSLQENGTAIKLEMTEIQSPSLSHFHSFAYSSYGQRFNFVHVHFIIKRSLVIVAERKC